MEIFDAIRISYPNMTKTERRIADHLLQVEDGHYLLHVTLKQLTQDIGVGQASIMRMINACGYTSYRSFMVALSQANYQKSVHRQDLQTQESALVNDWSEMLRICQANMRTEDIQRAAQAISQADLVVCGGFGNSSHIASLAASHLRRYGIMSGVYIPGEIPNSPAVLPRFHFALLAFSISGETDCIVQLAREYRENQQFVVSFTGRTESSLAKISNVTFFTPSQVAYRQWGRHLDGMVTQLFAVETVTAHIKQYKFNGNEKEET